MSVETDAKSAFSKHVIARLLEFTSARSPWNRRLWNVGSILALEEVYEAGRWVDAEVLSQKAVDWQCAELQRVLGQDPAIGSHGLRREFHRSFGGLQVGPLTREGGGRAGDEYDRARMRHIRPLG
ncbi:MAG: hypothetical protein QG597_5171 [Actinomycetota bacterium]|nr:hypothetical protein [Actinomycetota bacterium]